MSLPRIRQRLTPILIILVAIVMIVYATLAVTDWLFPGLTGQANLSVSGISSTIAEQFRTFNELTGLSVLADVLLLLTSYVLVCVFLWLQSELQTYLQNRSHFKS